MQLVHPIIVVPGVTATNLRDLYPMPPDTLWSLLTHEFDRVALHPENFDHEAVQPAQVVPDEAFEISYKEMVLDLRHDLSPSADRPVPVYVFSYDWRQPLETAQAALAAFIDVVIAKTRLMRHYVADGYDGKVNLIGHSMGGMVITGCLATGATAKKVRRVATIVTPFRGSFNAVEKILVGTASSREREAARLTPSLYYLLPTPQHGITIDPPLPATDLFDPALWQPSVAASIREALRLRGSKAGLDTDANAQAILGGLLARAKAHRQGLESFSPKAKGFAKGDWLSVVGVGYKTRVELGVSQSDNGPEFDLSPARIADDFDGETPDWRTGDGTVPYDGAQPAFAGEIMMKWYSPHDFGLLELVDKGLTAVGGLHGIIPNMNALQSYLVDFFNGRLDPA